MRMPYFANLPQFELDNFVFHLCLSSLDFKAALIANRISILLFKSATITPGNDPSNSELGVPLCTIRIAPSAKASKVVNQNLH